MTEAEVGSERAEHKVWERYWFGKGDPIFGIVCRCKWRTEEDTVRGCREKFAAHVNRPEPPPKEPTGLPPAKKRF